jgi:Bacterial Ig-like domain (group 3)/Galactose oxidase, central domain
LQTPIEIPRRYLLFVAGVISILALAFAGPLGAQTSATWTQLNPTPDPTYGSPAARTGHTAVYNPSTNRMIIFGGGLDESEGGPIVNDVWVLTNADGTGGTPAWIKLNPSGGPSARMLHQAVYDSANNRMIVQGGYVNPGNCGGVVNDTWVLSNADGTGGTPAWQQSTSGPAVRGGSAAYDAADNILIIWGGQPSGCGPVYDNTWILTNANGLGGGTGEWTQLSPANAIGSSFANGPGGYDPNSGLFIGIGTDDGAYYDMARLLSGAVPVPTSPTWTNLIPDWSTPQYSTSAVSGIYDPASNSLVTCCGSDGSLPAGQQLASETWVLNHANGQGGTAVWTEVNPSGGLPPARASNSLVYNSVSNRMIIFAGASSSGPYNDVWVLISPLPSPTTTVVTSSENPSYAADSVTFTATVSAANGTPTGSVTFFDGTTALATVTLNAGQAVFVTSSLAGGLHTIAAQYTPDMAAFAASSGQIMENVVSPSNLPLLNGNNMFTGNQTVNGTVSASSFLGNGSGLTNVIAVGLNCGGCVGAGQLGVNWALGDAPGGNALNADNANNALMLGGNLPSAFAPASGSPNYAPAAGSSSYVAKSGDTMTGALNLPANGLVAGSSQLVLANGFVGIGSTAPYAPLHVRGTPSGLPNVVDSNMVAAFDNGGNATNLYVNVKPANAGGTDENYYFALNGGMVGGLRYNVGGDYVALFHDHSSNDVGNEPFVLKGRNVGIGTMNPAATLEVNGTAQFDSTVTFAAGQSFPGTGTITAVAAGTGLSGGGTSGSVTLNLNTSFTDSRYLQLDGGTLSGALSAPSFSGNGAALTALNPANLTAGTAGINITGNAATSTTAASATNAVNATNASNAAELGGVSASKYARLDIGNSLTGNQSVTGNVTVSGNSVTDGSVTIGAGGTAITQHMSILVNPSFPALAPGACSTKTFTITGVADGDTTALGLPSTRMTGGGNLVYMAWVSATNTVTIQACNANATSPQKTAGSGQIRVDLWKH